MNGPDNPYPYSCEADMYSLGLSFLTILLGQFPVKVNSTLSYHYRQRLLLKKLYKWHNVVPTKIDSRGEESWYDTSDSSSSCDLSFEQVL
jgi:hypothetical protein